MVELVRREVPLITVINEIASNLPEEEAEKRRGDAFNAVLRHNPFMLQVAKGEVSLTERVDGALERYDRFVRKLNPSIGIDENVEEKDYLDLDQAADLFRRVTGFRIPPGKNFSFESKMEIAKYSFLNGYTLLAQLLVPLLQSLLLNQLLLCIRFIKVVRYHSISLR